MYFWRHHFLTDWLLHTRNLNLKRQHSQAYLKKWQCKGEMRNRKRKCSRCSRLVRQKTALLFWYCAPREVSTTCDFSCTDSSLTHQGFQAVSRVTTAAATPATSTRFLILRLIRAVCAECYATHTSRAGIFPPQEHLFSCHRRSGASSIGALKSVSAIINFPPSSINPMRTLFSPIFSSI